MGKRGELDEALYDPLGYLVQLYGDSSQRVHIRISHSSMGTLRDCLGGGRRVVEPRQGATDCRGAVVDWDESLCRVYERCCF